MNNLWITYNMPCNISNESELAIKPPVAGGRLSRLSGLVQLRLNNINPKHYLSYERSNDLSHISHLPQGAFVNAVTREIPAKSLATDLQFRSIFNGCSRTKKAMAFFRISFSSFKCRTYYRQRQAIASTTIAARARAAQW